MKEGIPFEELLVVEGEVKSTKSKRKVKEAEFELKIKGEDGVIQTIAVAEEPIAVEEPENTAETTKIDVEDTLQMIKQALKGKKKKATKKKKLVVVPNSNARFFNDYGENPHL